VLNPPAFFNQARLASNQYAHSYVTGIELTLTDGTYELWGHKK
jgi:hypothetical protein